MKRVLALLFATLLTGCGGVTFQGTLLPANAVTVSGLVTVVHFTATSDGNGTMIDVTAVTIVGSGLPQTITFCGNQGGAFFVNQNVRVSFTPGTTCGTVVAVVHL
ncbi:MAG TPA: hypothetical protein VFI82_05495 [Terriglobales bacterium]|jgi:hypothetical protein|nr:hypothetical protein [Terriglobales bacterium]